jgi:riboflavin synthase
MFTGIVEELGTVEALDLLDGDAARLRISGPAVTKDARHGDSIAVNGCCLTVVAVEGTSFTADVMSETLKRTSLGALGNGSRINLERAVTAGARLGGWHVVTIETSPQILRYVAEKGSIAVDGVSLTVVGVDDETSRFTVALIPTTLELTVLGRNEVGDTVNLEVDVIAKYVERLLAARTGDGAR